MEVVNPDLTISHSAVKMISYFLGNISGRLIEECTMEDQDKKQALMTVIVADNTITKVCNGSMIDLAKAHGRAISKNNVELSTSLKPMQDTDPQVPTMYLVLPTPASQVGCVSAPFQDMDPRNLSALLGKISLED